MDNVNACAPSETNLSEPFIMASSGSNPHQLGERQHLLTRKPLDENGAINNTEKSTILAKAILATSFLILLIASSIAASSPQVAISRLIYRNPAPNHHSQPRHQHQPHADHQHHHGVHVSKDRPGFPSYLQHVETGPIEVAYDKRSLIINGDRAFFISGSMHPVRASKLSWESALDEAVRNGLNMITTYVMWSAHQPFAEHDIAWNFPTSISCDSIQDGSCEWDLATAIRQAASRGLFVHIRIGPYTCAEFNYGGIPEWLPLQNPSMVMRRYEAVWMQVMEEYVTKIVEYLTSEQLWAYQGGPIILGQIENELGEDIDDIDVTSAGYVQAKKGTTKDYAEWCGSLAQRLAPKVVWTMCFGLSANNTIDTCNGDCGGDWLENNGDNGRIQLDQPALLTEFENGFQVWGENATQPTDYFYGRTARNSGQQVLKWFARGGTHLNYYMWWGGYNRGRSAAAGISNMYANDGVLCSSGQRHQPKFDYLAKLHAVLADIAATLLESDSALRQAERLPMRDANLNWVVGTQQRLYEYGSQRDDLKTVFFVENDADAVTEVWVYGFGPMTMYANSAVLIVDGVVKFDSGSIDGKAEAYERVYENKDDGTEPLPALAWSTWSETIGVKKDDPHSCSLTHPVEQTTLNAGAMISSDYAWYQTTLQVDSEFENVRLYIDTFEANGLSAFVDGELVGSTNRHFHKEGERTLSIRIGKVEAGEHELAILSESLGYGNLIGRWGGDTKKKKKGIVDDVMLCGLQHDKVANETLIDGRTWLSFPGLHDMDSKTTDHGGTDSDDWAPRWSSAVFPTPNFDGDAKSLFLHVTQGRGHIWLNSMDLGKFWNITKDGSDHYSQEYYQLPFDYLAADGSLNEITIFDTFGSAQESAKLALSWIAGSSSRKLVDEVDFADACI